MQKITVEVAYALPDKQKIISLEVPQQTTALEAIQISEIDKEFNCIDLDNLAIGIFGKKIAKPAEHQLHHKDRVEIYRPLIIDPKQARLNRLKKVQADKQARSS